MNTARIIAALFLSLVLFVGVASAAAPEITLTPETASIAKVPGGTAVYRLDLTNATGADGDVMFAYAGNTWDVAGSLTVFVPDGDTVEVTVAVTVAADAAQDDSEVLTVTATLDTETDVSTLTTVATKGWESEDAFGAAGTMGGGAAEAGGIIYFVGGLENAGTTESGKIQAFDPISEHWDLTLPDMPIPVFNAVVFSWGGDVYVAGGGYGGFLSNALQVFDPQTRTWFTEAALPSARSGGAGGVVGDMFYLIGGSNSGTGGIGGATPDDCPVQVFDLNNRFWDVLEVECILQSSLGLYNGTNGAVYNELIYFGGLDHGGTGWFSFDPATQTFADLANIPFAAGPQMGRTAAYNGVVYYWGGVASSPTNEEGKGVTYLYDIASDQWVDANKPMVANAFGVAGAMYVPDAGGEKATDAIRIYSFGGAEAFDYISVPAVFESLYLADAGDDDDDDDDDDDTSTPPSDDDDADTGDEDEDDDDEDECGCWLSKRDDMDNE
jgi:N-acetylneuraminic acid mutarotase